MGCPTAFGWRYGEHHPTPTPRPKRVSPFSPNGLDAPSNLPPLESTHFADYSSLGPLVQ